MLISDPLLDFEYIYKDKSEGVLLEYTKPNYIKTVLINDKPWEGECNGYYSIIKNNHNIYHLYYKANKCAREPPPEWKHDHNGLIKHYNLFCLAISFDGIHFVKPKLDIIVNNTNIILNDNCCSNICPIYLQDDTYFAIGGLQVDSGGMFLYMSNDGINWIKKKKILDESKICSGWNHINHFDTLSTLVYDKYNKKFIIYTRHNQRTPCLRQIQYTTTTDFNDFKQCEKITFYNDCDIELYANHIIQYPDSPFYIGFPTIHNQEDYFKFSSIMFSRDGIKWTNPKINFFNQSKSNMSVYNFVENLDMNSYYLYNELILSKTIDCYSIPKHKFCFITGPPNIENYFILEYNLKNNDLYILAENNGYIIINILDSNKDIICCSPKIIEKDNNFVKIEWNKIEFNYNEKVQIKIIFYNAYIYSIKYTI